MPVLGSRDRRGDHHVQINIATPKRLSAKQKELLREFGRESGEDWLLDDEGENKKKTKKGRFWNKLIEYVRSRFAAGYRQFTAEI